MAVIKGYLKTVTDKLKETKPERADAFKKGATDVVKLIVSKFDEFQIFTGSSYDTDASMAFAYTKEQTDEGPTFIYFADALKEEKF